ncbi:hypothetical protein FACS1894166_08200 [Bacilli bacterium]|nr:hypothetical protein FACS1894166_08200 [Bacilli bacterium]
MRIGFNEENNPFIILTKKNNKPVVQINTEILAHAHLNNDINEQLFESNPDIEFNYNANSFAQSIVEKFNSNNIQLTPEIKSAIEESLTSYPHSPFVNLDKYNSIDDSKDLPLNIIGSVVIGSFTPSESGLFQEYSKLMNNGGIDYLNKLKFRTYDAIKLAEEAGIPFKEAHLKEIVQLDFAQKKATKIALEDSLVIIGPPGTGKSQTISNIIANLISQSKSVLFTTALVGAADVVFNRLKRLRLYCLKLFETDNLRKEFTKQIRNNVNRITKLIEIRNQLDLASATNNAEDLDEIFKRVCEFKSLMYHADGHKYPKFVVDFNKEKDNLNKALALVSAQVKKAENSRVF